MDDQEVSTNKIPRLLGQENYIRWKVLSEAASNYNDTELWCSIKDGPYILSQATGNNATIERQMKKRDNKALSMLKLGLSWEILTSVNHHTNSKDMYDAVVEMFEGNVELRDIKKDRLKQQLDRFKFKECERLKSVLQRFMTIINEIITTDMQISNFELNKKLLSSLFGEWYTASNFIKEKAKFPNLKLDDVISFLQADEHLMIENHMIREKKSSFPVTNALVVPMGNLSVKSQQLHRINEEPSETGSLCEGSQPRFNIQMIEDENGSAASGHLPYAQN
ncbi:uncharacterized protein LOC143533833 [Bidens hawaiensis]|uniref:uncharacterized protein LOC143533833 n=1 Tax=Bidens hawaiensis TaxID=980011 RepID=UPI004049AD92